MTNRTLLQKTVTHTVNCSIDYLQQMAAREFPNVMTFDINCSTLPDFQDDNSIGEQRELKLFVEQLYQIKSPVLYYFEILSEHDSQTLREALSDYKRKKERSAPALSTKFEKSSKILYVGKVKKGFMSRIKQHLGYYTNKQTQGLQLVHWAKSLDLKIRLHYYGFPMKMDIFMRIIERAVAHELKPIVGKH